MEPAASLRQTVTHLFDAVRYSNHAREVEESIAAAERELELELNKLDSKAEEITNVTSSMKDEPEGPLRDLSLQLEGFLETAKGQAKEKLERKAHETVEDRKNIVASERDKALKSLEAYLATDPVPMVERAVHVSLVEGIYEARSSQECEGGMKYEFVLAAQNSKIFHQELALSSLGYQLRVPVRFAKTVLKGRVPGFERLDQYVLSDAEQTGGKLHALFTKPGNGSEIKLVTSGEDDNAFVGIEYSDKAQSVNVMNDASLSGYVDLKAIKSAVRVLVRELDELASRKVSLVRLSKDSDDLLESLDCNSLVQTVLDVLGPSYRELVKKLPETPPPGDGSGGLGLRFIRDRVKVLGTLSKAVSQSLGLP